MRSERVPAIPTQRQQQAAPAKSEQPRNAPQVLDLRQLKQVAGGTSIPAKFW